MAYTLLNQMVPQTKAEEFEYDMKAQKGGPGGNTNRSDLSGDTLARSNAGDREYQETSMPQFGNVRTERITLQNDSVQFNDH